MHERRKYFRHQFGDEARPEVKLWATSRSIFFPGCLIDLSLGGASVEVDIFAAQPQADSMLWASFATAEGPLNFHCQVQHRRMAGSVSVLGLRFLPLVDKNANSLREQKLWRFLLLMQRNTVREKAAAPTTFHDWKAQAEPTRATLCDGIPPPSFEE